MTAQILCSSAGTSTTGLTPVSLGSCTIPANTLSAGDRVEIQFTFAHSGVSNGFVFSVHWTGVTLVQRSGSAGDAVITGRGDASIATDGTTLAVQTWGSLLTLQSGVTTAANALSQPLKIDFQAEMSAAGTDSVALQNYTVLRYPAR